MSLGIHGALTLITTITPKPHINTHTHTGTWIQCTIHIHIHVYIHTQTSNLKTLKATHSNNYCDRQSPRKNQRLLTSFTHHKNDNVWLNLSVVQSVFHKINTEKVPFLGCSVCSAGVLFSALCHLSTATAHYQDCMTHKQPHTRTCTQA